MVKRKIIWTKSAISNRKEILEYWFQRTASKKYSKKLNDLFTERINYYRNIRKLEEKQTILKSELLQLKII